MTTTGAGNFHSKKNKYSPCPSCKKKGLYRVGIMLQDEPYVIDKCKYCDYSKRVVT